jgi:hypothetical protein
MILQHDPCPAYRGRATSLNQDDISITPNQSVFMGNVKGHD